MGKISILTDSLAGLPAELIKQYELKIIPGILTIDGKNYRDNVDITPDEFWRLFFSCPAPESPCRDERLGSGARFRKP